MGKEPLKKSLISCISPPPVGAFSGLWLWCWAGKEDVAARAGVTAGLCPSLVCRSVKCLILGRAKRLGHLGLARLCAKLSRLIISRAAAVRVHKFSPCMCHVRFPFMPGAGDRKLRASNVAGDLEQDCPSWRHFLCPLCRVTGEPELISVCKA